MNIMELGAIGELVGGVAVIASLVYVGLQVRQSAAATRLATGAAVNEGFTRAMESMFDQDSNILFREGIVRGLDTLSPEDRFRFGTLIFTMYCHFETVYFQTKHDTTDFYVVNRLRAMVYWFQNTPGVRAWWYGNLYDDRPGAIREMFSKEFRAFVQSHEVTQPALAQGGA